MRLLRLGLLAFGPFTDQVLDLSGPGQGGLHVIFGRNEAGKSTALRAVSGLLFGMGERTSDAHLHAARELRVSALLEEGGEQLACVRRKRRKDSLRGPDDEPLPESALAPFLHGVDATLFHTLFGLDHERLKHGGQALLSGQGDIAESLFDAGTGGRGVHVVLSELSRECEALFKVRASKPRLNVAIAEYRQAKKLARDEIRAPEKYLEQLEQLERAKQRRQELTLRRAELRQQQERLERVRRTLTPVAKRQECLEQLSRLGNIPELPEDVSRRRTRAQQTLAECARDSARVERELGRRREQLEKLPAHSSIVELSERSVAELRDKVGIHRKAAADLPKIRGEIKQAEAEARRLLRRIGRKDDLEQAERSRLDSTTAAKIRRLGHEHGVLLDKQGAVRARVAQAERERIRVQRQLEACGAELDPVPLESALRQAQSGAHLEDKLRDLELELAELGRRSETLARRLFACETGEPTECPPVPELETLEEYSARWLAAERALQNCSEELARAERELGDSERILDALTRQGVVPSEAELVEVRREREAAFDRLLRQLTQEPADAAAAGFSELRGYAELVARADELGDRLRHEAQRVAERAQLEASQKHWRRRCQALAQEQSQAQHRIAKLESEWVELWQGQPVTRGTPAEMLGWRRRYDEWQALTVERQRLQREQQLVKAQLSEQLERLWNALLDAARPGGALAEPDSAAGLLDRGAAELGALKQRERERGRLQLVLAELEVTVGQESRALGELVEALLAWRAAWQTAVAPLGLGESLESDEALSVLDDLVELGRKLDELPGKRRRVSGIERDARAFHELLAPWLEAHAPELCALPVDDAAEEFVARFARATQLARERQRLDAEIAELETEWREHQDRKQAAERELHQLLEQVGVKDAGELERLEQRWQKARELQGRLRELSDELLTQGLGASIEALVAEASATDRAKLVVRLDELKTELEETDHAWRDAAVEIAGLEQGLSYYSDESAAHAVQHLEQRAAQVRELLERTLRARLAKSILEREIARYRERHQGPVLTRSSELFQKLTLGRYRGLRVGLEERSLGCVRDNGDEVGVGQLSEGTQYQLYLALRLATLEHYVADGASIPLVLDDLLIHFDDERAEAAFRVLGELSRRVQILYFTHLSRDLVLSERAVDASLLKQHRLSVAAVEPERAVELH